MAEKKPLGITLITLYNAVFAVMFVPAGCVTTFAAGLPEAPQSIGVVGLLTLMYGVFLAASVYGLWTLQDWGRVVTIWLNIICLPLAALSIFGLIPYSTVSIGNTVLCLVGVALSIWIVLYLRNEEVQYLFD